MTNKTFCDEYDTPSGHSRLRSTIHPSDYTLTSTCPNYKLDYSSSPNFQNFEGPYKNYKPPGDRAPAVGEKNWGDVPYLRSYLDPMVHTPKASAPPDNLYYRGPFCKDVSETHAEFVNRGVPPRREYHDFVRHYEEPGMKHDISETHDEFTPPYPMLPRDKAPCLKEDPPKEWYEPDIKQPKNPHAKELETKTHVPQVVYIDEGPKRDFSTEHRDNYVCYQKSKRGTKVKDYVSPPEEIFLKNIREHHQKCSHSPISVEASARPGAQHSIKEDGFRRVETKCAGATPRWSSWLLQPKNYRYQNGVMLIPCKCRYDD